MLRRALCAEALNTEPEALGGGRSAWPACSQAATMLPPSLLTTALWVLIAGPTGSSAAQLTGLAGWPAGWPGRLLGAQDSALQAEDFVLSAGVEPMRTRP